jgi:hypothetical protein
MSAAQFNLRPRYEFSAKALRRMERQALRMAIDIYYGCGYLPRALPKHFPVGVGPQAARQLNP